MKVTIQEFPHFHRLLKAVPDIDENKFYFRDDGVLFYGKDEWDAKEFRSLLGTNPRIIFEDLQNAFRVGLVVAWMRAMGISECEPETLAKVTALLEEEQGLIF